MPISAEVLVVAGSIEESDVSERIAVIRLVGEVDVAVRDDLIRSIDRVLDRHMHLIVDIDAATFIDASTVGALVHGCQLAAGRGSVLVLQSGATTSPVAHLIEVAAVDEIPRACTRPAAIRLVGELEA